MALNFTLRLVPTHARFPILLAAGAVVSIVSCNGNPEKGEAANLVRVVTALRMADNEHKQAPLEQLRALPCTAPVVCDARNACVTAFEHHVRGLQLGATLRGRLADGGDTTGEGDEAALLLEMNVEVEEGRKAMPVCEERVASLRRKHRL